MLGRYEVVSVLLVCFLLFGCQNMSDSLSNSVADSASDTASDTASETASDTVRISTDDSTDDPIPVLCAPGCLLEMVGNGQCNSDCNVEECQFDKQECCPEDSDTPGPCDPDCYSKDGCGNCDYGCNVAAMCAPDCFLSQDVGNRICNPACNVAACRFDDGDCGSDTEIDTTPDTSENGVCGPGTKCCLGETPDCFDSDSAPIPGCGDECDNPYFGIFPCPSGFCCHFSGMNNETDGAMGTCYPEGVYPETLPCSTAEDCPCVPDGCYIPIEVSCSSDGFCRPGGPTDLPFN